MTPDSITSARAFRMLISPSSNARRSSAHSSVDTFPHSGAFVRAVRGKEQSGTVIWTEKMPVSRLYGSPDTHPEIDDMDQDEVIIAQPANIRLGDEYNLTPLDEWEF